MPLETAGAFIVWGFKGLVGLANFPALPEVNNHGFLDM